MSSNPSGNLDEIGEIIAEARKRPTVNYSQRQLGEQLLIALAKTLLRLEVYDMHASRKKSKLSGWESPLPWQSSWEIRRLLGEAAEDKEFLNSVAGDYGAYQYKRFLSKGGIARTEEYIDKWRNRIAAYEAGRQQPPIIVLLMLSEIIPIELPATVQIPRLPEVGESFDVAVEFKDLQLINPREEKPAICFYHGEIPRKEEGIPDFDDDPGREMALSPEIMRTEIFRHSQIVSKLLAFRIASDAFKPRFSRGEIVVCRQTPAYVLGSIQLVLSPAGTLTLREVNVDKDDNLELFDVKGDNESDPEKWKMLGHLIHSEKTSSTGLNF